MHMLIDMLIYNMHRKREFPMKINNLAELFRELFERPSYKKRSIHGAPLPPVGKQTFDLTDFHFLKEHSSACKIIL